MFSALFSFLPSIPHSFSFCANLLFFLFFTHYFEMKNYSFIRRFFYLVGRGIRETGQAIDRIGCRFQGNYAFVEQCMILFILYSQGEERTASFFHCTTKHLSSI
jgi:hypothetical protein